MKNFIKFLGIILAISLFIIALPVFAIVGAGATFYYWKKKPNQKKMLYSGIGTVIALIGSFTLLPAMLSKENTPTPPKIAETPKVVVAKKEEPKHEEKPLEEKQEEVQEPEIKNDGPEYTDESNQQFATYFDTKIREFFAEDGFDIGGTVIPVGNNLVYVYVPQDMKYEPKVNIQKTADALFLSKNALFNEWAIENGYDSYFTKAPHLYVKATDDTTLAEESGIFERKMKVKVNN